MPKQTKEMTPKATTLKPKRNDEVVESVTETVKPPTTEASETTVAKAGKRSAKAQKEIAEKTAKEERKSVAKDEDKPKIAVKPSRSRLERRGKAYRKSSESIDKTKHYSVEEAVKLAKASSSVKFDATVELHVNLDVDPRHSDQNVRDNVILPHGTGKKVRVAALTDDAKTAQEAGADIAGLDDLLTQLEKGKIDFDVLIATPTLMARLGKYARLLGPRGLMPNPKSGTVSSDIVKAISEAKAGRVEYRVDSTGIVHLGVGKVSFAEPDLLSNVQAVLTSIKNNKPGSVKGSYIKSVHLATTMGPSIPVDLASVV